MREENKQGIKRHENSKKWMIKTILGNAGGKTREKRERGRWGKNAVQEDGVWCTKKTFGMKTKQERTTKEESRRKVETNRKKEER